MKLQLLTISNCPACSRLKSNLDRLQYSLLDTPFTYEVINVEKQPEYAEKYQMQSAPMLIFPTGKILRYNVGSALLQDMIEKEYKEYLDKKEEL